MFERFRGRTTQAGDGGRVAAPERPAPDEPPGGERSPAAATPGTGVSEPPVDGEPRRTSDGPVGTPAQTARPVGREHAVGSERAVGTERTELAPRRRQYAEFGGVNSGSAFFGWLVAVGLATLLIALLSAAGTAIGLTSVSAADARNNAGTIGIVGGSLLVLVLLVAYYAGGYVAGRMSRFDGGRQGAAVWLWGLVITLLLAGAGAAFGSQYNLLAGLKLPRIPVDEGSLATGGAITLGAILLGTLLAAIVGGKVGQRYHLRVDRAAAYPADESPRAARTGERL